MRFCEIPSILLQKSTQSMDLFYLQKSDNSRVWLSGFKARTRLEFTAKAGYFDFIGNDGEAYTILDVQATNIYDLNGYSALLMGIFCGILAFPYAWYYGFYAFFLGFIVTRWVCVQINCDVEHFNNSHFNILR